MIENWHSHTTTSDGKLTYAESLEIAQELGIGVVAFTDHDSLPNKNNLEVLHKIKSNIKWVMGVEVSAITVEELGGKQLGLFHILGLFVDPQNRELQIFCRKAQSGRLKRMYLMVNNLQKLGFDISAQDCLSASKGETVGRPQIVTALKSKERNLVIIDQLLRKMKAVASKDRIVKEKYEKLLAQGESQYPYDLFLNETSFIPNIFVNHIDPIGMDSAVKLIRNAGGIAILAHYYSIQKSITQMMLDKFVYENRLDGLETTYGLSAYGGMIEKELKESREVCKAIVKKYNCIETGGMDSHTVDDWRDFTKTVWFSKETEGMLDKMLATKKIKLTKDNCNFSK